MVTKKDAWTKIEGILIRIGANEKAITEIKRNIETHYVTKEAYEPVKKIAYGLSAAVLLAVIGAVLNMVIL